MSRRGPETPNAFGRSGSHATGACGDPTPRATGWAPADDRIVSVDPAAVAAHSRGLLFTPEPGACAGRLNPRQTALPTWLARQLDGHVWPGLAVGATNAAARVQCEHIDWESIWRRDTLPWERARILGAPATDTFWHARSELAEYGYRLCLDVEIHPVYPAHTSADSVSFAVHGAGVIGMLTDRAWDAAAPLLTTCASVVRAPWPDPPDAGWLRPARPTLNHARRPVPTGVNLPLGAWQAGDWLHTWWTYHHGPLAPGCPCPAHSPADRPTFGPGAHTHRRAHDYDIDNPERKDGEAT